MSTDTPTKAPAKAATPQKATTAAHEATAAYEGCPTPDTVLELTSFDQGQLPMTINAAHITMVRPVRDVRPQLQGQLPHDPYLGAEVELVTGTRHRFSQSHTEITEKMRAALRR